MSDDCYGCSGTDSDQGSPGGGGGGPSPVEVLFAVTADIDSAAVFPAVTSLVSLAIPPNTLAADGDSLRGRFTGLGINGTGAGLTWFPFLQMSGVAWWGGATAVTPAGTYSWECEFTVQRRAGGTAYRAGGRYSMNNSLLAPLVGVGEITVPAPGSPIASVAGGLALNWALAQTCELFVSSNAVAPGNIYRIQTGTIELVRAP